MRNKILTAIAVPIIALFVMGVDGCSDADIASHNISKAADNFEVVRKIVIYDSITGAYVNTIEGRCSLNIGGGTSKLEKSSAKVLRVTCKEGEGRFFKHHFVLSDNVLATSIQLDPKDVSVNHTRVTFKPQAILPDIDFRGSVKDLPRNQQ